MVDDLINEYKDEELHMISILQSDRKTRQNEHCGICGKASESDTARITYLYGTLYDQHKKTVLVICDNFRNELREKLLEYEAECEMCERMYQEEKKIFIGEIKKAYKESQKNPDGDGSFYIKGTASDEFSRHIIEEEGFDILERKNDVFIGQDELTDEKYYGPRYRIRKIDSKKKDKGKPHAS